MCTIGANCLGITAYTALPARPAQALKGRGRGARVQSVQGVRQTICLSGIYHLFVVLFQGLFSGVRNYSGGPPLTLSLIQQRVILVLQLYDKVDPAKVV